MNTKSRLADGNNDRPVAPAPPPPTDLWRQRIETVVAYLFLGTAIVLIYALLQPTLSRGSLPAGDDAIHSALSIEAWHLIHEQGKLFSWSYMYGMGAPLFIFRPPGYHIIVQLMHAMTFGLVPVQTVHKFGYVLALMLYPAAVYYMMRKFRFRPLICGLAALLTIGPISTWGHTIDAYYDLGLAKQAFAILLFPFVLGKFHGIVAFREKVGGGIVLFGLMFLNHPYMGLSFCMLAAVYILIEMLSTWDWRYWLRVVSRFIAVVAGGMMLIAFWLVPFYSSPEVHPTQDYSSSRRHGFAVRVETVASTIGHLAKGSLFDHAPTPKDRFGGDTVWAWRDTSTHKRWPVLSLFGLLGAGGMLATCRNRKNAFFVTAWLASLIIFMGPDDIPLLRLVPFQSQFQYSHFVFAPELFTVSLASVGLGMLVAAVWRPLDMLLRRWPLNGVEYAAAFVLIAAACTGPFIYNVQAERAAYGRPKLRTRQFETGVNGQTAWSLKQESNRSFKEATDSIVEHLSRFERFYGSPTDIHSGKEIFHFTLAPAYLRRCNLISPLFGGLLGGLNNIVHTPEFRRHLWKSSVLMDLFRVESLITSTPNLPQFPFNPDSFSGKHVFGSWAVYDRKTHSPPFGVTQVSPVLVVGNAQDWQEACASWVRQVQPLSPEQFGAFPFLVWQQKSRKSKANSLPLELFAAVLVTDGRLKPEAFFARDELARYRASGRPVVCLLSREVPQRPPWATRGITDTDDLLLKHDGAAAGAPALAGAEENYGDHAMTVDLDRPGLVYFKAAFYQGWQASVDGRPAMNVSVSPGLNACYVDAGRHTVRFVYKGANRAGLGRVLSCLTILVLLADQVVASVKRRRTSQGSEEVNETNA